MNQRRVYTKEENERALALYDSGMDYWKLMHETGMSFSKIHSLVMERAGIGVKKKKPPQQEYFTVPDLTRGTIAAFIRRNPGMSDEEYAAANVVAASTIRLVKKSMEAYKLDKQ